ncbi:hypothetical protein Trydic_g9716 [Trypoxylus dichotomus]
MDSKGIIYDQRYDSRNFDERFEQPESGNRRPRNSRHSMAYKGETVILEGSRRRNDKIDGRNGQRIKKRNFRKSAGRLPKRWCESWTSASQEVEQNEGE